MNGWIDCKDRLPKKGKRVMIWVPVMKKRKRLNIATLGGPAPFTDDPAWFDDEEVGWWEFKDVTHWRPQLEGPNA